MICRCLWLFFLFAFGFADLFTFTEASTAMDVLPADSVLLTEMFDCETSAIFTILILRAASEPQHTNTRRTSSIEGYSNNWYSNAPIQP